MSTIHVHNWAGSTVPTIPSTQPTTETAKETTEKETSPTEHYLKNLTLNPASSLLPKAALAQKATSSITVGNCSKPKITQIGPDTVELPDSHTTSSCDDGATGPKKSKKSKTHKKSHSILRNGYVPKGHTLSDDIPSSSSSSDNEDAASKKIQKSGRDNKIKLKNGYVPKGYTLSSDGNLVRTDTEGTTGTRYHATEQSISMTREKLEGGGTRKVWVRTERHVTVLIQGAKAAKTDEE